MTCELCAPQDVVAENALAYVRRDNHALSRGHVLVVPRRHVADFFDLAAQRRIQREHSPDGYNIGVNIGSAGDVPDPAGGIRCVLRKA